MGLLSFVKGAGKKLWGSDEDDAAATGALQKEVADFGLDSDGLDVTVDGDKVTLTGKPKSVEMKEKIMLALGNVMGIAGVNDDSDDDSEGTFHTVEKGDTLWAVSKKALGDGNRYNEIFEANRPMLTHPDKIYPGQVLRIPA